MHRILRWFSACLILGLLVAPFVWAASARPGQAYYIAPYGRDGGPGSSERPWRSFEYAFKRGMRGGDTLILKDGLYREDMGQLVTEKPWAAYSPPSGSPRSYTVIKAENDGRAVLASASIYLGGVRRDGRSAGSAYIQIEGLKLGHSSIQIRRSHHIKVLRTGIKNGMSINSRYGQVIQIAEESHHILLEDVWIVGAMRYGINVFESSKVILRRVVVRFDGNTEREPKSGICFYGATGDITGTFDSVAQNCIVLDFNPGSNLNSGMQNVHAAKNIKYYGCIALNLPTNGFYVNESYPAGGNDVINSVVWDVDKVGMAMKNGDPARTTLIDQVTVGAAGDEGVAQWKRSDGKKVRSTVRNSLFIGNGKAHIGIDEARYNLYEPENHKQGREAAVLRKKIKYIVSTPDEGTGEGGLERGAIIEARRGVDGTLWGEPGYNVLTDKPLWPWPYEDRIHADFSERDRFRYPATDWQGKPYKVVNNPARGFAAPGQTLTRYIWGYLGHPVPKAIDRSPEPASNAADPEGGADE